MIYREIIESIQVARSHNKQLKIQKISVFYEATQQKFAIKKFISNMEKLTVFLYLHFINLMCISFYPFHYPIKVSRD